MLTSPHGADFLHHYLDEVLSLGPPSSPACYNNLQACIWLCSYLACSASQHPTFAAAYLGALCDPLGGLGTPEVDIGQGYSCLSETKWHFELSSRYCGFSRCVPRSFHRLPRSSRPAYSSRRLVKPSHHASLLFDLSSAESVCRTLESTHPELIGRGWDQIVRSTWKMEELRGILENAINKIEAISSTPTPNDNNNLQSTSSNPVISRAEANWR